MSKQVLYRKNFIRQTGLGLMGLALVPKTVNAQTTDETKDGMAEYPSKNYTLKNVRLETGFEYMDDEVTRTKTELYCITIAEGKIKKISTNRPDDSEAIDAKGYLMLPAFKDMHIHLDKTFYGGAWHATQRRTGCVKGMIELEKEILPGMLKTS